MTKDRVRLKQRALAKQPTSAPTLHSMADNLIFVRDQLTMMARRLQVLEERVDEQGAQINQLMWRE